MESVRIGIIGIGNMGSGHAGFFLCGEIKRAKLTAVCDIIDEKVEKITKSHPDIVGYHDYKELILSGNVDAVIIATPHYLHPEIAIFAFEHGMHVISEKPVGVYVNQVLEMNKAAEKSGKVFSSMFCVRTSPQFKKIKWLVESGEIGDIKRINWIATDWYRPQSYHDSASWRSSWKGEGGGVLVNQSPHNLDMIQWIFGMPDSITAFAQYGKYYNIEVEDEVTAYLQYKNYSCVYIASTGEAPGTNRLEIAGDRGRILFEDGHIMFKRNTMSEREFNRNSKTIKSSTGMPEHWDFEVPVDKGSMSHKYITQNFVNAILDGEELIAPGLNGVNEVMISNAIHYSSWTHKTVELPVDNDAFYEMLQKKIAGGKQ